MLDFSEIKLGKVVQYNNQPCVITKCDFLRMQQRKPVKKCILKNLITGNNVEYSFKSGEAVEEADLKREPATFLYQTGNNLNFLVSATYETVEIDSQIMSDKADYLSEGQEVVIQYFNDDPISVDLPVKISFKIMQTDEVAKGNTVNNVLKEATIETGKIVRVPSFIKVGEKVVINTVEDSYVERDNN
ncbi:MAG: elongation factor P [Patescibacteria group bacterium]